MSRKLRFFKDQISKAGLLSSARPTLQPDIGLEELEVYILFIYYSSCILFLVRNTSECQKD